MHDTTRFQVHEGDTRGRETHERDDSVRGDAPRGGDRPTAGPSRPARRVPHATPNGGARWAPRLTVVGLVLAALLTGCTVAVRHGESTTTTVQSSGVIVWAHLGLQFAFPGVVVVERHAGPHHFDTVFTSDASLRGVYGDVDERMRAKGWHRHRYEERNHRVTAVYVRGDQEARVVVVQEGRSGRYRLTIDD